MSKKKKKKKIKNQIFFIMKSMENFRTQSINMKFKKIIDLLWL